MDVRRMLLGVTTLSIVCGVRPLGVSSADTGAAIWQPRAVTAAQVQAAVAKERAETVREKAARTEQEAAAAEAKATEEKQKSALAQVHKLERELAEVKAQETPRGPEHLAPMGDCVATTLQNMPLLRLPISYAVQAHRLIDMPL